ncbi:MAG: dihydroxyacetone kinase subunit DhaL [Eubacteriales bacterium]|nr:dihydroxyacetone kinase subunit DhaL [Eubacteriales bacterium]
MHDITTAQLKSALLHVCDSIIQAEPMLTELDTVIGDGDHGIGMRIGFTALHKQLSVMTYESPYHLLHEAGMTLIRVMGGTSGVIFGTLFIGGLSAIESKESLTLADFSAYISGGTEAIQKRGRVNRGDKTMYDALIEASESLKHSVVEHLSFESALNEAAKASVCGMENTKAMISRMGRSKNFREKTIGHPDTGAVSVTIIFKALAESFTAEA